MVACLLMTGKRKDAPSGERTGGRPSIWPALNTVAKNTLGRSSRIDSLSAEFERALIRERQRKAVVLAKQRGVCRGRKKALATDHANALRRRVDAGEKKAALAR